MMGKPSTIIALIATVALVAFVAGRMTANYLAWSIALAPAAPHLQLTEFCGATSG